MKASKLFFIIILLNFFILSQVSASCIEDKKTEVTIIPKECRVIDPQTDVGINKAKENEKSRVVKYGEKFARKGLTDDYYKQTYTGALITNDKGWRYFYNSTSANICESFPIDKPITKKIKSDCCDTGEWGNCIFGGNFIYD